MKKAIITIIVPFVLIIAAITGEIKCVIKMVNCNWEPVGKAEVIYTVSTFTGLGCIVGWIEIEDK
jgi:hypothetical protein